MLITYSVACLFASNNNVVCALLMMIVLLFSTLAGVYISESCIPTYSERLLFDCVVHHRRTVTIREAAVELFGQADVQLFGNDKNFVSVLKVTSLAV